MDAELILDKVQDLLIAEVERAKRDIQVDCHFDIRESEAEERACDDILENINNGSEAMYDLAQFLLYSAGYEVGNMDKNPYYEKPKKSQAQEVLEEMMGISDLSQLLKVRF